MQKTIIFIISKSPFCDDRPYHLIRMALSLAMDAKPILLITGDALLIDTVYGSRISALPDVVGQLRLFDEMVGKAYRTDLIPPSTKYVDGAGGPTTDILKHLSLADAKKYIREADAVFTC